MQAPFYLAALFLVKSLKSRLFNYDASTGASADADADFGFQKKFDADASVDAVRIPKKLFLKSKIGIRTG